MKAKLVILGWLIALGIVISQTGCKESDLVITTADGWKMHSVVPVDTTLR